VVDTSIGEDAEEPETAGPGVPVGLPKIVNIVFFEIHESNGAG
jgi:hypothetical protein